MSLHPLFYKTAWRNHHVCRSKKWHYCNIRKFGCPLYMPSHGLRGRFSMVGNWSLGASMAMSLPGAGLSLLQRLPSSKRKPNFCSSLPLQQQQTASEEGIMCECCNGRGWLLCDFCKGQKTNVKSETNRIYRRCPTCRAVGYTLCTKCKVFKCVTFPDSSDGVDLCF